MLIKLIIFLLPLMSIFLTAKSYESEKLTKARNYFYEAVNDEKKLKEAIGLFKEIIKEKPELKGLAITYIGSLEMLKGKHAFWPTTKLKHVDSGLEIMDNGIKQDPDNIESLFIYGSTCHYLPFFLGKSSLADSKLRKIVDIIDEKAIEEYDNKILLNVLEFLQKEIKLNSKEIEKLDRIIVQIKSKSGTTKK